jgi:hypothetical protein
MRSLIVLIALRATGVSANRRRLTGVGLGNVSARGPYVFKIDGIDSVLRFPAPADSIDTTGASEDFRDEIDDDTPATRRSAPRTFPAMFM